MKSLLYRLRVRIPVLFLLLVTSALAQPAPKEPPPLPLGKLVDVGGHKMHIYCTGIGDPTVILEAGAGAFSDEEQGRNAVRQIKDLPHSRIPDAAPYRTTPPSSTITTCP